MRSISFLLTRLNEISLMPQPELVYSDQKQLNVQVGIWRRFDEVDQELNFMDEFHNSTLQVDQRSYDIAAAGAHRAQKPLRMPEGREKSVMKGSPVLQEISGWLLLSSEKKPGSSPYHVRLSS